MKTLIALVVFIMAILGIMILAGIIVATLLFWPPCTQIGHNCVVDGWSIAGLAGTILAVAATMLAVLGAVAVAYWWLKLDERVNDQVTKLYEAQKKEVNALVDQIVQVQQQKVNALLAKVETQVDDIHTRITTVQDPVKQASLSVHEMEPIIKEMGAIIKERDAQLGTLMAELKKMVDAGQKQDNLPTPLEAAQLADTTTPTASEN